MQAQKDDPDSLYNTVKEVIRLRHENPDLQADGPFEVLIAEGTDFVYRRGSLIVAMNPSAETSVLHHPSFAGKKILYRIKDVQLADALFLPPSSFVILK